MTIVCGVDFSDGSAAAARVAAAIAARLRLPLEVVHAVDSTSVDRATAQRLDAVVEALRAELGSSVEGRVEAGAADEALVARARQRDGRLLVVGSLGGRRQAHSLLGTVAERTAQSSPIPVLIVRDAAPLLAWARGERPLRAMVGVEPTSLSHAALRWAEGLREVGPCELIVVRIFWPAEVHERAGVPGPIPLDHLPPAIEQRLLDDLRRWAGTPSSCGQTEFLVKPGWGRVDTHLTQAAAGSSADLLVVGTMQRTGIARLWQGSVSRGVLHSATMSVACVPRPPGAAP